MRIEITQSTAVEMATGGHRDVKVGEQFEVSEPGATAVRQGSVTWDSARTVLQQGKAKIVADVRSQDSAQVLTPHPSPLPKGEGDDQGGA